MSTRSSCRGAACLTAALLLLPAPAAAQQPVVVPAGQQPTTSPAAQVAPTAPAAPAAPTAPRQDVAGPAVQPIATASAISKERLGAIMGVRELRDGRLLVNDGTLRRLVIMDSTMKTVEVVLDSASAIANAYGTRPGALLPFRGDSSLFVDAASYAMLVLDPAGKVVRVRSVWRVQDIPWVTNPGGVFGTPGVDARGRIVYRVPTRAAPPSVPPPAGVPYIPQDPDSAFVVAADIDTRKVDTLAVVRVPVSGMSVRKNPEGGFVFEQKTNPIPISDDWAVLADGTVAVLRERDYRIEFHNPDGSVTSSGKLPYPWQRLSDDDKQRIVDSVMVAQKKSAANNYITAMIRWVNQFGRSYPAGLKLPDSYTLMPGMPKEWKLPPGVKFPDNYIFACPPGVDPMPAMMMGGAAGAAALGAAMGAQGARVMISSAGGPGGPPSGGPTVSVNGAAVPAAPTSTPPGATPPAPQPGSPTVVAAPPTAPGGATTVAAAPQGATAVVAAPGSAPGQGAVTLPGALQLPGGPGGPGGVDQARATAALSAMGVRCLPAPVSFSSGSFRPPPPTMPGVHVVAPSELPDYRPPISAGAARADMDGNLWIRPVQVKAVTGGPIFDVVDRSGTLTARLQLPPGYTVAGFGRGRVVYLTMRDMTGIHLARVRLK